MDKDIIYLEFFYMFLVVVVVVAFFMFGGFKLIRSSKIEGIIFLAIGMIVLFSYGKHISNESHKTKTSLISIYNQSPQLQESINYLYVNNIHCGNTTFVNQGYCNQVYKNINNELNGKNVNTFLFYLQNTNYNMFQFLLDYKSNK